MNLYGIVVAAGRGLRFGAPKATASLQGKPLWEWARDALEEAGVISVVVVGDMPGAVPGGQRRRDSVQQGLDALPADATHALIHDAARPLASADLARAVAARLDAGDVAAVVPVLPVRDTLKRTDGGYVVETVDRGGVGLAQTPQGVEVETLRHALSSDDEDATDEAQLIERAGGRVAVVPGEPQNLKITYAEDLVVAQGLIE